MYTSLELVVVGVQRGDIGLETLAHTDALDEVLELGALLERSCNATSDTSVTWKDIRHLQPFIKSQWSNTIWGNA